ncbi:MAG: CvpA family protein [Gammaproteobacteria bacterium]
MVWVDYLFIGIIALSVLFSLWRGFFKEALSLLSWVVALVVAVMFFEELSELLASWIESPTIRNIAAFALLFLGVLLLGGIINYLVSQLVSKTGLTATDRILGIFFGAARGIILSAILVLAAGFTSLPLEQWWSDSMLIEYFQELAIWLKNYLPENIQEHISFSEVE